MAGERGERGGVVIDGPGEEEMPKGEEGDAALAPIEAPEQIIPEPGGTADPDGGTEDPEAGENDPAKEVEVPENGEKPGAPDDDRLSTLEKTLQEIRTKVNEKPVEQPKPMSEEDWAKLEQDWGAPRTTIERVTQQSVKVYNKLTEYIDSKFAKLEFSGALDDFSKTPGFQDAGRYKKDINEFLSGYDPRHWGNPELLKKAVFYARGVNANANVLKARTESERNRKIAGVARPASPNGGVRKVGLPPLTQAQREAAALMPGGEAEYNKFRSKGRVVIE